MRDILFLAHRVPFPPDRGDKIRAHHVLKHLAKHARVHLVAMADVEADLHHDAVLAEHCASHAVIWRSMGRAQAAATALLRRQPISIAAFAHPEYARAVQRTLAAHPIDTIFVYSGQMAQYVPAAFAGRIVMDFCDVDSAKFADYAEGASLPMAIMMRREDRLLARFEAQVAARADASLFVSEAEAALFRSRTGAARVQVIENGIDTGFFDPAAGFAGAGEAGPLIVFTGQMDYRPNVDAVIWFAREVMPLVRRSHPTARFAIVGRAPVPEVSRLASESVLVTGEVADVRGWLAAAAVVVAPLKIARGIQNKVLEAMAMARPVLASAAAAEGIDHAGTITVADTPAGYVSAIDALIAGPGDLGPAARRQVERRYGWPARLGPLDALLGLETRAAA
ncbi:TIGR03087 family PEP-CTERM/XrtA system glycosyltransferase [Sphingomonas qomolangmaensis]|uniref:TIGR03087 family PEP-CTERM/XrtA system glycosyltransferase n=1 Tax=Sphingomonas qomolangmaensis TaxID=2918765 RepID=A0ABY5LBR7_9SPHN|nr:TIGR03087 family PEP-CTERM/XrtA system glycosyltransferase [Sphingomonas qomolangmaensis]UUL83239.1 TIGR03087 family PEP-CTERM/XrtA system glycosyltransferase [Sphingomonas qomolangmaensis]